VRAVEQQPLRQAVEHDLLARHVQLDAQHQPEPADLFHERVLPPDRSAPRESTRHALDRRQQLIQHVRRTRARRGTPSAPSAERAPVHAGLIVAAAFSLAAITPSGIPHASGFAVTITSGMTIWWVRWYAKYVPGRPTPHCVSSATSSALWRSASSRALHRETRD